jgi:hypothetical protein
VAKIYPDPETAYRGRKGSVSERFPMVAKSKLSEARTILAYAPALVALVVVLRSSPVRRTASAPRPV